MRTFDWEEQSFFATDIPFADKRDVLVYEGAPGKAYWGTWGEPLSEIDLETVTSTDHVPEEVLEKIRKYRQAILAFSRDEIDYVQLCAAIQPERYYVRKDGRIGFKLKEDIARAKANRRVTKKMKKECITQEKKEAHEQRRRNKGK